jgi:hypothetical protein
VTGKNRKAAGDGRMAGVDRRTDRSIRHSISSASTTSSSPLSSGLSRLTSTRKSSRRKWRPTRSEWPGRRAARPVPARVGHRCRLSRARQQPGPARPERAAAATSWQPVEAVGRAGHAVEQAAEAAHQPQRDQPQRGRSGVGADRGVVSTIVAPLRKANAQTRRLAPQKRPLSAAPRSRCSAARAPR